MGTGGEKIKRLNKSAFFIFCLLLMFITTMGMVSAQDVSNNKTIASDDVIEDVASVSDDEVVSTDLEITNIYYTDVIASSGDSSIDIQTKDSYNPTTKTWVKDGINLADVNITVSDSSNNVVFTGETDVNGAYSIDSLAAGNYKVQLSYSTYEPYTQNVNLESHSSVLINHMFVPDIMLLVSYESHSEKVDYLMGLSKRDVYISTTDYDKTREWLLGYANFVHVDMFAEGSYSTFTSLKY